MKFKKYYESISKEKQTLLDDFFGIFFTFGTTVDVLCKIAVGNLWWEISSDISYFIC